ncbi:heme O synthase [Halalkalibacter hemicellulosilyticusJCM 9152]|uniref:heme o synthase n=1 Tax=Halalkalibacter hemicellulosilyticusJCM 9152 TaxID=1236971 RepID=W4QKN7_9BACI|nr:heme O synthase [Halalkalibacter hemicellulosilyticusJCM 9152]
MNKSNTAFEATEVISSDASIATSHQKSWKDYLVLAKHGIVTSNLITTFAGFYLAVVYTGVGLGSQLSTMIFALVGAALVMAGGCTLNNYIDRDIDHIMERTKERPSVTGRFSANQVLVLGLVQAAAGLAFLSLTTASAVVIG